MSKHLRPEPPATGRRRQPVRILILALALIGAIVAGFAGMSLIVHENPFQFVAERLIPPPQQVFGKSNLLVLVEGLDYDYTDNDIAFSTSSRSDIIWAVNLDFTNKRIYELSVPRDMVATLPDGKQRKINQAQADGGVTEAAQVISQWLGIPGFDKYIILRIDASKEFINALGGVDIDVKNSDCLRYKTHCKSGAINYDDNWGHLHVHLKEGMQHLDGPQAVGYARFRHDWCSDPCRIMRQQQVIHALVAKLETDKLNTVLHLGQLIDIARRNIQTNLTNSEMLSLANYYIGIKPSDVKTAQVPYIGDVILADGDDIIPDAAARARLVQEMLIAPPTPEPSPDAMALAGIAPTSIRVDVENGSGVPKLAEKLAAQLKSEGFQIGKVGNAQRSDHTHSVIREHSNVAFAGAKVRAALPLALQNAIVVDQDASDSTATPSSDVTIVIGRDYATTATVASPKPGS